MTRFRAIIFDLDDTLYPEKSYVFSGYRAVAEYAEQKWDIPSVRVSTELRRLFERGNRTHTFDAWLATRKLDPGFTPELVDVYRNHTPRIQLFAGMRELLAMLSANAYLGLISDGHFNVQRLKLEALNIEGFFKCVVFSDRWGRANWKPADRPYLEALRSLGVRDASQAVYVGDNPIKDFITARALGMHTIQLWQSEDGIHHGQRPPSPHHAAHTAVTSVDDLKSSLLLP